MTPLTPDNIESLRGFLIDARPLAENDINRLCDAALKGVEPSNQEGAGDGEGEQEAEPVGADPWLEGIANKGRPAWVDDEEHVPVSPTSHAPAKGEDEIEVKARSRKWRQGFSDPLFEQGHDSEHDIVHGLLDTIKSLREEREQLDTLLAEEQAASNDLAHKSDTLKAQVAALARSINEALFTFSREEKNLVLKGALAELELSQTEGA